jgi:hypothetical protein
MGKRSVTFSAFPLAGLKLSRDCCVKAVRSPITSILPRYSSPRLTPGLVYISTKVPSGKGRR